MKVKMILPALTEAKSPFWRPIKYSLFPPIGLATLAAYIAEEDEIELIDEHVEHINFSDKPDLVVIQVYITNAYRAYKYASHYRNKGCYVIIGGLHVTSLPNEALAFADSIFIGPGEETFPEFLEDFKNKNPKRIYFSNKRTLKGKPLPRRDLIKRDKYLVPNSIVVSRGCPHHCDFCYKDSFFKGGKSFYTSCIDDILNEISELPGRHLYFLDDHLFGNPRFAKELFFAMKGMNRLFQGAATVQSVLNSNLLEMATEAGLRSLFVGFETLNSNNLAKALKFHNTVNNYEKAVQKLHDHGVMINGSFVFGLDDDDISVFDATVEWAVNIGITTATFHIATPYPGTQYYQILNNEKRIKTFNWDLYDTRHAVFQPNKLTINDLENGYKQSYKNFYAWRNIYRGSMAHENLEHKLKHFFYTAGWKKIEPFWNVLIKAGKINKMIPILENLLTKKHTEKQYNNNIEPVSIREQELREIA